MESEHDTESNGERERARARAIGREREKAIKRETSKKGDKADLLYEFLNAFLHASHSNVLLL